MNTESLTTDATAGARLRFYARAWYWGSRPVTLTAAIVPIFVGSALAFQQGAISPLLFASMVVASMLVQIGVNFVDEYTDDATVAGQHKLVAPHKVIARGLLSRRAVRQGAGVVFGVATLIGLYIVSVAGWPILVICVLSLAAAYFYTAGPKTLGSMGLGPPVVFVFMGPVMVVGAYYVLTGTATTLSYWVSLPVACMVTAILVTNDLRDVEEDRNSGKGTFVTKFGPRAGKLLWSVLVLVAVGTLIGLVLSGQALTVLVPLLALWWIFTAGRQVWSSHDRPMMMLGLRATAALHGRFGLLLALGLALGRWV